MNLLVKNYIPFAFFVSAASLLALNIPWTSIAFVIGLVLLFLGFLQPEILPPKPVWRVGMLMVYIALSVQVIRCFYSYRLGEMDKALSIPTLFQIVLFGVFRWVGRDKERFFFLFRILYCFLSGSIIWFLMVALFPFLTPLNFFLFADFVAGFALVPHLFGYHVAMAFPMFLILWHIDGRHKKLNFIMMLLSLVAGMILVERSSFLSWTIVVVLFLFVVRRRFKMILILSIVSAGAVLMSVATPSETFGINEHVTYADTDIFERFQSISSSDEVFLRSLLQRDALLAVKEYPLGMMLQADETWSDFVWRNSPEWREQVIQAPHNGFLTMVMHYGLFFIIPGLLVLWHSFVWCKRCVFSPAVRKLPSSEAAVLFAMPAAFLANCINGCFHNASIFFDKFSPMFFFIFLSMISCYWDEINASEKFCEKSDGILSAERLNR